MKRLIIIALCVSCFSCSKQEKQEKDIINSFVRDLYLSVEYEIKEVNQYMTSEYMKKYNSLSIKDRQIHEKYIKAMIDKVRETLSDYNFDYQIIKNDKLDKEKYLDYYDLFYHGNGEIFRLVSGNNLILFFILEDDKIYSFSGDIYLSSKNKIVPYFFFDEDKLIKR